MKPQPTTCPQCRRSMRLWALDARLAESAELRDLCVRTAQHFRDAPCFGHPRFDPPVPQVASLAAHRASARRAA